MRFTDRTITGLVGESDAPTTADPIYLYLQLALLSDSVVTQIVQLTQAPLHAAVDARQRELLLRLRLDYASTLWSAASGPNPRANAINMTAILAVGRVELQRPPITAALGPSLEPMLDALAAAEIDVESLVRSFLSPNEFEALRQAIETQAAAGHGLAAVDLEDLLSAADSRARVSGRSTNLFRLLGVDPFAGLDPATREIAESRQFGERLLFNLQRMPFLLRLNSELLANDVARELELERIVSSVERASKAMSEVAGAAAALPDQLSQERARVVAEVRAEADRLGALAHEYRGAFEAASSMVTSTNEALQTFGAVVDRLQPGDSAGPSSGRPFDINEYSHAASTIGKTAASLTGLLGQVENTLDSPGLARVPPLWAAALDEADARGRRVLYLAFALGCALIAVASLATIATVKLLRRQRGVGTPGPEPSGGTAGST